MSDEMGGSRAMTTLEKAAAGGPDSRLPRGAQANQISTSPPAPFRLWQKGLEEELAMLEKSVEQLEAQLTPYLMPQTEPTDPAKDQGNTPQQSELVGWLQVVAQSVKNVRGHVELLSRRLEV